MKYTKEEILKGAFSEFISRGYDSTTISDLQKKLNMSRGGMYRHFKNKEDLFKATMDKYIFEYFNQLIQSFNNDIKVPELIELLNKRRKLLIDALIHAGATYHTFLNFTALLIQAVKHYPDFAQRFKKTQIQLSENWKIALRNSIAAGEIKKDIDIDILSKLFAHISITDSKSQPIEKEGFSEVMQREAKEKNKTLLYLYNMIRT